MLDDSIYRQFQSMPFSEQLGRSSQSVQLRQTLLMNEIFKCGKDIFGNTENEYENQNISNLRKSDSNKTISRKSSQKRYIYEYDYGKDKNYKTQNNALDDYSADQISFTLSNEDNPRNSSKENHLSPNPSFYHNDKSTHITWKNNLIQDNRLKNQDNTRQYLSQFIQNQLKNTSSSQQKVAKWKKPLNNKINFIKEGKKSKSKQSSPQKIQKQSPIKIKDNFNKKTFDLSNSKLNYFPDSVKKRKSIFQQKSQKKVNPYINDMNYSSYQPKQKNFTFKTPQKNVIRKSQVPLSEQITKNVYGRLKEQISGNSFIKQFESQQKKTQQQSEMIWKGFIDRSDQWMEKKKNHAIQRKAIEKYQPNYSPIKPKNPDSPNKQYYSYIDMKYQQKTFNKNNQIKFQQTKFQPEYTFKNKNRQSKSKSAIKKQSSVENCINKLKTQTELLKIKLLSPLKNHIEDDEMINHYKELNQSQSKKLVRKFSSRQDNQFNKMLKDNLGYSKLKIFYGNCIGNQREKQIRRN